MSVVASRSASPTVAVAVAVSCVLGLAGVSATAADGAESATVTAGDVVAAPVAAPSFAATRSEIASPRSPLPACERSSVVPFAPTIGAPFFSHCSA